MGGEKAMPKFINSDNNQTEWKAIKETVEKVKKAANDTAQKVIKNKK